jgi:hypothetical protein
VGISFREFGRRIDRSHESVRRAVKRGVLTLLPDGTLDPEAAEREWKANLHPGRGKGGTTHAVAHDGVRDNYRTARAARETYAAKIAQTEYRKMIGELVPVERVKAEAFAASRRARDLLNTLPARLAPVVAGYSDPRDCYRAIEEEVRRVCDELSKRNGNTMM